MIPVFDIEVIEWTEPIAVGFFDGTNYKEFLKVSEDFDVVWEFLSYLRDNYPGIKLYAHNATNFDNKFILNSLHQHGEKVRFIAGMGKIIWVDTDISFEDSYLLLGRSLSLLCKAFNVESKLEWEHSETVDIWEMQAKLDSFRAYLKRDCLALSEVLDAFCKELINKFGIVPSSTLALTSVKIFDKKFYPVKNIHSNEDNESFIRYATYGGRNEVYRRYGENLNLYDIRSMYLSCYDVPVPIGKLGWVRPNLDRGILAEAVVKVPKDSLIGPLPYRHKGHLVFPVGEFKGWWDMRELKFSTSLGCDISITRQLDGDEDTVLKEFGDTIFDLRSNCGNRDLSRIWNLLGLRLSGKFGQHRWRTEVKHISEIEDFTGYYPIDESEVYHEASVYQNGHRSPYVKPAVNMRIRSEARIRHLEYLLEASKVGRVYYCDTDSVYTDVDMPLTSLPGGLQLMDYAQRAYFIQCKFYGYVDKLGNLKQRTAGYRDFKLWEVDFKGLLEGQNIQQQFQTISNWRDILKRKGITLVDRYHPVSSLFSGRNRIVDGLDTQPIKLPE